ncbi:hypothetical protein ACE4WU_10250 [Enterococcus faecalis]|uniref:hypothetical protein n=1 Tax=Enterococcus faecalis TaxID=1351 RepID=UPI0019F592FD|nr:hypothetical protein [Enterococcus faecalis]EGO9277676.1 hypothetical protein [Enterococcus faecalis]ELY8688002.1 hypothetical protein [Enterococcus faecalis]
MIDLTSDNKKEYRKLISHILSENTIDPMKDFIQEPYLIKGEIIKPINDLCPFCGEQYSTLYISNFQPTNEEFYTEKKLIVKSIFLKLILVTRL